MVSISIPFQAWEQNNDVIKLIKFGLNKLRNSKISGGGQNPSSPPPLFTKILLAHAVIRVKKQNYN